MAEEEFEGNTDELIARMELDDLEEAVQLSPREFARMVNVSPQLVYYHIRKGHIEKKRCLCGRTVVNVEEARAFWTTLKSKERPDAV